MSGHGIGVSRSQVYGWYAESEVKYNEAMGHVARCQRILRNGLYALVVVLILSIVFPPAFPGLAAGIVAFAWYWSEMAKYKRQAAAAAGEKDNWKSVHEVW